MGNKVTFDGVNRIIQITEAPSNGVVEIDVKIDIYSDGKEDWLADAALSKLKFPVSAIGGNPLPGSRALGTTFFLDPSWKIRPYEASHTLRVNGNLYSPDGVSPFVTTLGTYNVFLEQQVSSLVDSTVQQLEEIQYASFGGGVSVNPDHPKAKDGIAYPAGTKEYPCMHIADAVTIADLKGFDTIFLTGTFVLDTGDDVSYKKLIGANPVLANLTINPGAITNNCEIHEVSITGTLDGGTILRTCIIQNLNYVNGVVYHSILNPGNIVLGGEISAHFLDCYSGVPGMGTPTIDCAGDGPPLTIRNYNGGIKLINKTGPDAVSIDINSGQVILDSTVTNGVIVVRGVGGQLTDNSNGATVYNQLVALDNIKNTVWNAQLDDYTLAGSIGLYLKSKVLTVAKFLGLK